MYYVGCFSISHFGQRKSPYIGDAYRRLLCSACLLLLPLFILYGTQASEGPGATQGPAAH